MNKKQRQSYGPQVDQVLAQIRDQTGPNPIAVDRFVQKLKNDCGTEARIEVIPDGTTHGGTQRKFVIVLICKKQKLSSVCKADDLDIIDVQAKRSGAFVSTQIILKVENASVHPQTSLS